MAAIAEKSWVGNIKASLVQSPREGGLKRTIRKTYVRFSLGGLTSLALVFSSEFFSATAAIMNKDYIEPF